MSSGFIGLQLCCDAVFAGNELEHLRRPEAIGWGAMAETPAQRGWFVLQHCGGKPVRYACGSQGTFSFEGEGV